MPVAGSSSQTPRGPIGKLKDQIFGTKEYRNEQKKLRKEEDRARREAQREYNQQMNVARQQYYASPPPQGYDPRFGGAPCGRGYDPRFGGPQYGGGYDPRFGGPSYGSGYGSNPRRRGGGGLALPLLGGLAGGLLLGELFDDGFGGGDFGGGDFGGF